MAMFFATMPVMIEWAPEPAFELFTLIYLTQVNSLLMYWTYTLLITEQNITFKNPDSWPTW